MNWGFQIMSKLWKNPKNYSQLYGLIYLWVYMRLTYFLHTQIDHELRFSNHVQFLKKSKNWARYHTYDEAHFLFMSLRPCGIIFGARLLVTVNLAPLSLGRKSCGTCTQDQVRMRWSMLLGWNLLRATNRQLLQLSLRLIFSGTSTTITVSSSRLQCYSTRKLVLFSAPAHSTLGNPLGFRLCRWKTIASLMRYLGHGAWIECSNSVKGFSFSWF